MLWGTHICLPVSAGLAIDSGSLARGRGHFFAALTLPLTGLFGVLPDIFSPHVSLEDRFHSFSHSAWFMAGLLPVCFMVAHFLPASEEIPRWRSAILFWLAAVMHSVMDMVSGGVAWLYPWKPAVTGDYYIPVVQWLWWDAGFVLLTWILWRLRPLAAERGIRLSASVRRPLSSDARQESTDREIADGSEEDRG